MWDLQGHGLHSAPPLGDEFFLPTSPDACFSSRQVRIALGFLQKTLPGHSILILRVGYGPPLWSSGSDSMLSVQGAQVPSLVRN